MARSKRVQKVLTEDQEQITLMSWAHRVKYGNGRLSDYLIHILMVGQETSSKPQSLKIGVKAGAPDLQLLVPNGLIHGLWIELKSKTGEVTAKPAIDDSAFRRTRLYVQSLLWCR